MDQTARKVINEVLKQRKSALRKLQDKRRRLDQDISLAESEIKDLDASLEEGTNAKSS